MRISVRVKPRSRKAGIEKISEHEFVVALREPPIEGKANEALIKALARYFDLAPSRITVARGTQSRIKIVDIVL